MPPHSTTLGNIQIREVEGQPGSFEGIAIPFGVSIDVPYGRERFVRGAFADQVRSGETLAYLNRHGENGGVPVGAVTRLEERDNGLYFGGNFLDVPAAVVTRSEISSGINGVSVEFVPGKHRRGRDGTVEHFAGVRLAGIAGSYAPAYRQARVALRSVGGTHMPPLSSAALTERRSTITQQQAVIRQLAETENRQLDDSETQELATLEGRITNIDALITNADAEARRAELERRSLPQGTVRSPAIVTRSESIYGPRSGHSYFADMIAQSRDVQAAERMGRHRALVFDLAQQIEQRDTDSSDIAGAYPTQFFPDLYVADIAYTGPLSAFFPVTPITGANPILIPTFGAVTGDTEVQPNENDPLANIDVSTAPLTLTPKTIGGESTVSRQAVDGASPGTDVIIGNQLRELLMRDTEREIALVLEALPASGAIADTGGAGVAQSGQDLARGLASQIGQFYAGAAAGGAGARMLPPEGVFVNATDWGNLVGGEDVSGRPVLAYVNPVNALGQVSGPAFQKGILGGVTVEPAWALLADTNEIIARRNDARQWKSAVLDIRLMEREGPQSIVFVIWQYFAFAVLQPKGVRRVTYTNI
jgi:HK97 family phage prohead protease/HK97 family phage major capsid protein